jgi:hypothetical protein
MAGYMGAVELAWTLADSIDEHLPSQERHRVYVALGSGDPDSAIVDLASVAARERIMLPRGVINALRVWVSAHRDIDARLGTVISAIPVAPEPHRTTSRQKTNYLTTARDYRRTDSNPQTGGSA